MILHKKKKNLIKSKNIRKLEPLKRNNILTLEPLLSPEDMKITEEKKIYFFFSNSGFTDEEIDYIKNQCHNEGIKYTLSSFINEDLEEVKIELREILKQKKINKMKKKVYEFFELYSKNKFIH